MSKLTDKLVRNILKNRPEKETKDILKMTLKKKVIDRIKESGE